jgi:hypothetical protein
MEIEKQIEFAKTLNGQILACLNQGELHALHLAYERGRKFGVTVTIKSDTVPDQDVCNQLRAVVAGDKSVPLYRENAYIHIDQLRQEYV